MSDSSPPENARPSLPSAPRRLTALASALGPLLVLFVVIGIFGEADQLKNGKSVFFTHQNTRTIAVQASPVIVAALGMTVIIIAGGIDLAAGTALALSATVLAWFLNAGYSAPVSIAAAIGTGCLTGFVNGVLVSALRVVPFIVTLGTMTIYLGIAKYIANETTIRPPLADIPHAFETMVTPRPDPAWLIEALHVPNVAWGVWLALVLAVILALVLRYTVFGRYVFALGSNEQTARLCGINVPLMKIAVYTLGGLFVGIAGTYQFARLSSGNPMSGIGMELKFIAAVVIGGGSLTGGRGSVLGTVTGAVMMAVIASGCTLLGWRNPIQDIVIGAIIIAAVTLDQVRQRFWSN
ncbi:MAG TPA: ABC transporter permease [Pirellulales bacterium]|nr:ABC transporter permease [Pirellulales bacterium]